MAGWIMWLMRGERDCDMTLRELKKQVDEAFGSESPETPVEIFLMNGMSIPVGRVVVGVYTDGTKKIGVEERVRN